MSEFDKSVSYVIQREGGLVDDKRDDGGITNFGISYRFYKSLHPAATSDDIRNMTIDQAKEIYRTEFWDKTSFDKIDNQSVATMAFDMAVNIGIAPSVKVLQRAAFSVRAEYELFKDDGILGENTLAVLNGLAAAAFLPAVRSERAGYYREIVAREPSQKVFLEGWLRRAYTT